MAKFDPQAAQKFICEQFDKSALPALVEFIKIDNLSRSFDANWKTNGKLEQAAKHIIDWVTKQEIKGLQIELIKD